MTSRALGQVFTPPWLADRLVDCLSGTQGRVLDPACGDGSLLVALCRDRVARGWSPSEAVRSVEGWDRDPIAANACRAALKALGGGEPTVHIGDALAPVSPDGRRCDEPRFDAVIMNPPFVEAKRMGDEPGLRERLRSWFPAARGAFDLYVPFLWRAMGLVSEQGAVAAILPGKVLQARYAAELRRAWLTPPWHLRGLVDLTRCLPRPFPGTSVYPCIVHVSREAGPFVASRYVSPGHEDVAERVEVEALRRVGGEQPLFVPFASWSALAPLFALPRLGDAAHFVSTCSFHTRGLREQFVTAERPPTEAFRYLGGPSFAEQLELAPFRVRWAGWWIRADAWERAREQKNALPDREAVFARPKLVLAQHATRPIVAIDREGFVTKDTYPVGWPTDPRWSLEALCAVVGSTVFAALYNTLFQGVLVGGDTYHYLPAFLHQVPVPADLTAIDAVADDIRALHDREDPVRVERVDQAVARAYGVDEAARQRMSAVHLTRDRAAH